MGNPAQLVITAKNALFTQKIHLLSLSVIGIALDNILIFYCN